MGDLIQQPQQLTLLIIYITNLYHKLYQRIFYSQVHRSIYKDSSCSRHKVKKQLKSLNHTEHVFWQCNFFLKKKDINYKTISRPCLKVRKCICNSSWIKDRVIIKIKHITKYQLQSSEGPVKQNLKKTV